MKRHKHTHIHSLLLETFVLPQSGKVTADDDRSHEIKRSVLGVLWKD